MSIPLLLHAGLMVMAVLLVVTAALIAYRRKTGWLARHKPLALSGMTCALTAFAIIFIYKLSMHYPHFHSPHAIAGGLALILLVFTPAAGLFIPKGPAALRSVHKILGRITAVAVVVTAVMGVARLVQIIKK